MDEIGSLADQMKMQREQDIRNYAKVKKMLREKSHYQMSDFLVEKAMEFQLKLDYLEIRRYDLKHESIMHWNYSGD